MAAANVLVLQTVADAVKQQGDIAGLLLGLHVEELGIVVTGRCRCGTVQQTLEELAGEVASSLPPGLQVVGAYSGATAEDGPAAALLRDVSSLLQPTAVLLCNLGSWVKAYRVEAGVATDIPFSTHKSDVPERLGLPSFLSSIALVRCAIRLRLDVYTPLDSADEEQQQQHTKADAVRRAAANLRTTLNEQASVVLLRSRSKPQQMLLRPSTEGTLATAFLPTDDVLQARLLSNASCSTSSSADAAAPGPGPVFDFRTAANGPVQLRAVELSLDVLCYVPGHTRLRDLGGSVLLPALLQQLAAMEGVLLQRPEAVPLHEDSALAEQKLQPLRLQLHRTWLLPENRALLRFANALDFSAPPAAPADHTVGGGTTQRLRDVHINLKPPGTGAVSAVDGSYEYYHYMQDRFNDSGWGCAYRSLQTLCSWFLLQRYTAKPVPGHRAIQQLLVRLGDKAPDFVGSAQWIGAIELSYILDEYLGVTSKIITVNRGADIPSHARELAAHFAKHGTPVMIGGGVLAYTLLGVQFDEATGHCAFLILDPHYTGGEDLKKIHGGSWVGWKRLTDQAAAGGPLFVKDAFYNFLCPQRPQTV